MRARLGRHRLMTVGEILVSGRSLVDYRVMFGLTDDELRAGPILDCPSGAGIFGAEARSLGGTVVGVDPLYSSPPRVLASRVDRSMGRALEYERDRAGCFTYPASGPGSAESTVAEWRRSAALVLADLAAHPSFYVAAALPALPFAGAAFRMAVCGYLLFTYSDYFGPATVVASIVELTRVTAGEVRIFPLVDQSGHQPAAFARLVEELAERGIGTQIRATAEHQRRGADRMMVCRAR